MDESHQARFKKRVLILADLIYAIIHDLQNNGNKIADSNIVAAGKKYLEAIEEPILIQNFIRKTSKYWDDIHNKNEEFFSSHASSIFGDLPTDKVQNFNLIFTSKDSDGEFLVKPDERNDIWVHFAVLVKIAIKHIHDKREPYIKIIDGVATPKYRRQFYTKITDKCDLVVNLPHHAKIWKVELLFEKE